MSEKDLPSGSDESDVDFVPDNENNDSLSEESGSSDKEESDGETDKSKRRKRRKRRKPVKEPEEEGEPEPKKKEIDVDALWADFKDDVSQKKPASNSSSITFAEVEKKDKTEDGKVGLINCNVKEPISNVLGRNIPSTFRNKSAATGGLASVLNKLGKKDKLSTLEKSKLDWNKFKQSEGIDEEIKSFNRGKDGYLEKQDFLQRTDLRQFEIEKQLRATKKTFR